MLSVIICTYNRDKYILPLLKSIAANALPFSEYELIVVDNNCTDNTHGICMQFAADNPQVNFKLLTEPEQGLSAARNCGIRNSSGDLLMYVDDDALVDNDFLQIYVDWFNQNPHCMAAGGPIEPKYDDCSEPKWMTSYTKALLTGWMNLGDNIKEFPAGKYPVGCNSVFRKEVFNTVGFFNTALGRNGKNLMGGEEKDIFDKMRSHNMEITYLPTPVLYHIIPPVKLSKDYFDRLTVLIGKSERQRTKDISQNKYLKRMFLELIKWCGTLVLLAGYTISLHPAKGIKLVKFRRNVTAGLLGLVS